MEKTTQEKPKRVRRSKADIEIEALADVIRVVNRLQPEQWRRILASVNSFLIDREDEKNGAIVGHE